MDLRVSGDDGQPTREYVAIAFPLDKAKWNPQLQQVRTYVPPQVVSMGRSPAAASVRISGGAVGTQAASGALVGGAGVYTISGPDGSQERISALAPGEYYVIAVDDIDTEDWQDPAVLERLTSSATRVVVTDEAPVEVPLRRFNFADVMR